MNQPIAWYDPSNGVVSTDKNDTRFTPLGQLWPLYRSADTGQAADVPEIGFGNMAQVDDSKKLDHVRDATKMVEPVAHITGYYNGRPVVRPVDVTRVLPTGMALYRSPPKRNPMTEQQLDEMFDQAEIAIYIADRQQKEHLEVYSFGVRDAEKWHGIGGEE